jgi:hypothetical protein
MTNTTEIYKQLYSRAFEILHYYHRNFDGLGELSSFQKNIISNILTLAQRLDDTCT